MSVHEFVIYAIEKNVPGEEIIIRAMVKPGFRAKYPDPEDVPVEEWDKIINEYLAEKGEI